MRSSFPGPSWACWASWPEDGRAFVGGALCLKHARGLPGVRQGVRQGSPSISLFAPIPSSDRADSSNRFFSRASRPFHQARPDHSKLNKPANQPTNHCFLVASVSISRHGCRCQGCQCQNKIQQGAGLLLLHSYVPPSVRTPAASGASGNRISATPSLYLSPSPSLLTAVVITLTRPSSQWPRLLGTSFQLRHTHRRRPRHAKEP